MSRIVYVNGRFCPEEEAQVSIFDRGLLFADAVYEVVGVLDGKFMDFERHMARLASSLGKLEIPQPLAKEEILEIARRLVQENALDLGMIYLQITRGAVDRDYLYPAELTPTVFMFTQESPAEEKEQAARGVKMRSVPDLRWKRRDIKTVGLLGQVLAKKAAKEAGGDEALMLEDGYITEGGATSFYIIKGGKLITRPLSNEVLAGCTRASLLDLVRENDLTLEERRLTLEEALEADEAFITAASLFVCPVIEIDGRAIAGGHPGPLTRRLNEIYRAHIRATLV